MYQDWEPVILKKETKDKQTQTHNDDPVIREMTHSIQKAIQQARMACKMSQKELATKLQVQPSIIIDYENGKAVPNNLFISKLEKALGTKLPRAKKKEILQD
jgi:ribosome-binding protein aMBF1 (putative translation factor)